MHLGGLLSTQEGRVTPDSYLSFVLSNLPRVSITRWLHTARLPVLNYMLVSTKKALNTSSFLIVPSRAPTNVSVVSQGLNELLVSWYPVPSQYANGRILGYNVYYKRTQYYYYSDTIARINNTKLPKVVLPNIQTGERYQISVAAFTSVGTGPRSSLVYVTKGKKNTKTNALWLSCKYQISTELIKYFLLLQFLFLFVCLFVF